MERENNKQNQIEIMCHLFMYFSGKKLSDAQAEILWIIGAADWKGDPVLSAYEALKKIYGK